MIVVLKPGTPEGEKRQLIAMLERKALRVDVSEGVHQSVLCLIGEISPSDAAQLSGWYSAYTVDKNGKAPMKPPVYLSAQRNAFGTSAGAKAVAAAAAGTRTFALKSVKGEEWAYDLEPGGKALSVVVKQNGVATLSGKIGSVKVSGTATLEVGETAATVRFFTSKFVIEVTSVVEDGEVAETFGKVWRR